MSSEPRTKLERRVYSAAEAALAKSGIVTPLAVFAAMGWLPRVEAWEREQVDHLERLAPVDPAKLAEARAVLRRWAEHRGLLEGESTYLSPNRGRRPLRFTAGGDPVTEREYRTHWTAPGLTEARRQRLTQKQNQPPDLLVTMPVTDWRCAECRDTGPYSIMDAAGPLCLSCADLDHLVFLPAGNTAMTRRAKKASGLSAVVVRFNKSRKRHERQGILVEETALEQAEQACLADEEVRLRRRERDRERRAHQDLDLQARMTELIRELFPRCPADRAESIARHTGQRGSGRVGRSAAGRALDAEAITRAVVAAIRHEETEYDAMLMSGVERAEARERIKPDIDAVLARWRGETPA